MKNMNELTFTEPCCATCAAWKQTQGTNGECHLMPPVPLFAGFQQPPQIAGLQMTGKLPPQPIILGAFPAVNAQNICRQWQIDVPPVATKDAPRPEFVPDCPVEDGVYVLPSRVPRTRGEHIAMENLREQEAREIEGAKHQDEISACEHKTLVYRFDRDGKFCEDCGAKIEKP